MLTKASAAASESGSVTSTAKPKRPLTVSLKMTDSVHFGDSGAKTPSASVTVRSAALYAMVGRGQTSQMVGMARRLQRRREFQREEVDFEILFL